MPIGLIILFESAYGTDGSELRLGYMLAESAWGRGLASELVSGFVEWCQNNEVASVTGGVERNNIASRRVLEKCGFVCEPSTQEAAEQLFVLRVRHNKQMQRTAKRGH
jgi:RimJ/RimL family protein N-acetyltransferase